MRGYMRFTFFPIPFCAALRFGGSIHQPRAVFVCFSSCIRFLCWCLSLFEELIKFHIPLFANEFYQLSLKS